MVRTVASFSPAKGVLNAYRFGTGTKTRVRFFFDQFELVFDTDAAYLR